jgi:hypothetical protein
MFEKGLVKSTLLLGMLLLASGCATRQPIPQGVHDGELKKPGNGKGMLYVYRPSSFIGGGVYYDIHDSSQNDKVLGTITSGSVIEAELPPGPRKIWAKTESKPAIPLTIQAGKTECVEAGVSMGILVGRPSLKKADLNKCRQEIKQIIAEQKKRDEKPEEDLGFGFAHKKK